MCQKEALEQKFFETVPVQKRKGGAGGGWRVPGGGGSKAGGGEAGGVRDKQLTRDKAGIITTNLITQTNKKARPNALCRVVRLVG